MAANWNTLSLIIRWNGNNDAYYRSSVDSNTVPNLFVTKN